MRTKVTILVFILILLSAGGGATLLFNDVTPESLPGALVKTSDPEASVFRAEPWQAQQFVWMVGFILFNMFGIGVTLAVIMWLLNRGVANARGASANTDSKAIESSE